MSLNGCVWLRTLFITSNNNNIGRMSADFLLSWTYLADTLVTGWNATVRLRAYLHWREVTGYQVSQLYWISDRQEMNGGRLNSVALAFAVLSSLIFSNCCHRIRHVFTVVCSDSVSLFDMDNSCRCWWWCKYVMFICCCSSTPKFIEGLDEIGCLIAIQPIHLVRVYDSFEHVHI